MSQVDEDQIIEWFSHYIRLHDSGARIFHDLVRTSKTLDDLKNALSKLVNVYFYETSILFKVACVSTPVIVSLKKTIDNLPNKEEFDEIKNEAQSQYNKMKEGLEIIRSALERSKTEGNIYG